MVKKRIKRVGLDDASRSRYQNKPSDHDEGKGFVGLDVNTIAADLAAEYDTLDSSLILAILLDYPVSDLAKELPAIRDQLAILQATTVPDTLRVDDVSGGNGSEAASVSELANSIDSMAVSSSGNASRHDNSNGDKLALISRASSGNSEKSKRTTSISANSGLDDELALLGSLFPALTTVELQDARNDAISLQAAIDQLLSVELINDVERNGFWPDEEVQDGAGGFSSDDDSWNEHPPRKAARSTDSLGLGMATPMSRTGSASSARVSRATHSPLAGPALVVPVARPARSKAKKTALFDTFDRMPTPSSSSSRLPSRTASPARKPAGLSGSNANAWHTIASLAAHLSELLPLNTEQFFISYLHSAKYRSAYAAVRASLADLPPKTIETNEVTEAILQDLYGVSLTSGDEKRKQGDLKATIRVAGDDVGTIMDLVDLLEEISHWPSDEDAFDLLDSGTDEDIPSSRPVKMISKANVHPNSLLHSNTSAPASADLPERLTKKPKSKSAAVDPAERIIPGAQPAPSSAMFPTARDDFGTPPASPNPGSQSPKLMPASRRQIHPLNWRKVQHVRQTRSSVLHPYAQHIPSYALGQTPHDPTPNSLYTAPEGYSIRDCLRQAAVERHKREVAIRAAGKHFGGSGGHLPGGKGINSSVAGHYAAQARQAGDQARDWELRAARMVVNAQLESNGHTVDLHHLTTNEAVTVALETASRWSEKQRANREGGTPNSRPLIIVTGIGRHSAGKVGVLGPAVAGALERDGWRVERYPEKGYVSIRGRR